MQLKYFIKTYGCQMNAHESEKLAGLLESKGYISAAEQEKADVIVLNTCCIRESAETHILGNLGIIKKLKEKKPSLKVVVCGCMAQQDGKADDLKKRCPFVDIIIGTHNLHLLCDYLDRIIGVEKKKNKVVDVWAGNAEIFEGLPVKRASSINASVNITFGCNNFCSYCIVPYVRGRERSRDPKSIVSDVEALVKDGYKEITLLGQNVNSYACGGIKFAELLDMVSDVEGEYWIKFMTSHPKDLSEEVVKVIARKKNLAHFIHLPLQSGSDRVLSLMNRKYTAKEYFDKIDMIRRFLPDVGLSCDIMVGFPTETEEDFLDTLKAVERIEYANLYSFVYSPRKGTPAAQMEQVDDKVKTERIQRLIARQFEIAGVLAQKCVGETFKVLCDGTENGKFVGKTQSDKKVMFAGKGENPIGKFVNVKITDAQNSKLCGTEV